MGNGNVWYECKLSGGVLEYSETPAPDWGAANIEDWNEWIKSLGWEVHFRLGSEYSSSFVMVYCDWPANRYLIEIEMFDASAGMFVCTGAPVMLRVVGELAGPIMKISAGESAIHFMERIEEVLLNGKTGLRCAQDWHEADRRKQEYWESQRIEADERARRRRSAGAGAGGKQAGNGALTDAG